MTTFSSQLQKNTGQLSESYEDVMLPLTTAEKLGFWAIIVLAQAILAGGIAFIL